MGERSFGNDPPLCTEVAPSKNVSEFQDLLEGVDDEVSRSGANYNRDCVWADVKSDIFSVIPLGMMLKDFEIVENVELHILSPRPAESIEASGLLYGRTSLSRLALIGIFSTFTRLTMGLSSPMTLTRHTTKTLGQISRYLSGEAAYAVRFYFLPDRETQLIIPVKCIYESEIAEWPEDLAPSEGWYDDDYPPADPLLWSIGSPEGYCMECEEEFTLDEGAIIDLDEMGLGYNQKVLCKKCRP